MVCKYMRQVLAGLARMASATWISGLTSARVCIQRKAPMRSRARRAADGTRSSATGGEALGPFVICHDPMATQLPLNALRSQPWRLPSLTLRTQPTTMGKCQ
jgi:hypothetical protein